ncbi:uncharacterized protein LOC115010203 [Cottoperca gobio]|uniref:Uncharacterized protein LOC115010203 n=1 Tax=Cottoperca gobio TaxID=56716 RepID=A0A6J2PYM0_COTGO|nr:uncharacterized protein LOC115010203 [Cottoperca gobio]
MSAFVTAARVVEFTAMAVQFEISWLCTLLFWGCICFPHQKGYIAHGYSLNGNEVSYHDGVFDTQMSNQFDSNTNQDSIRPSDEMQAMRHQSFLSLQREPVNQECNEEFSSVTSLSEDMAQNKPDSEHYVPSAPPVQKYVHDGSGSLHPFGILLKKHTQAQTSGGTSFQTIQDVKRFIETMKRSFLMPGGDKGRHFQTAKETMANEMASNAQNIKGVNPPNSPSQYFSNHLSKPSNIMPLTSENIQQPKYTRYRKPSGGFGNLHHIQSEELNRGTPANVLSYTNNFYVDSPRGQHSIEYLPKERPAKSFQAYQPTFNKESKDINYTPTAHLSVSSGYVSASPVYPSPQSSSGHVSVQTSSPHDAQKEAFTRKQPVSLHRLFTVKPSSSLYGSSRHDDYLQGKIVHFSHPSTLSTQAKDEKPDLFKQHLVSATRGLKQKAGHNLNLISSGFDSTHSGISSWVGDSDANFNSHTNFAPTSASEGSLSKFS